MPDFTTEKKNESREINMQLAELNLVARVIIFFAEFTGLILFFIYQLLVLKRFIKKSRKTVRTKRLKEKPGDYFRISILLVSCFCAYLYCELFSSSWRNTLICLGIEIVFIASILLWQNISYSIRRLNEENWEYYSPPDYLR